MTSRAGGRDRSGRVSRRGRVLAAGACLVATACTGGGARGPAPAPPAAGQGAVRASGGPTQAGDLALVAPAALRHDLESQQARAVADVRAWLRTHPDGKKKEFLAFAIRDLGPPPPPSVTARELTYLRQLKTRRTPAGVAAADQLDLHGKIDIWDQYVAQEPAGAFPADRLRELRKLLARATKAAKALYARPGPRVRAPDLAPGSFDPSKTSYPSSHATFAYAQAALLAQASPDQAEQFLARAAQIVYSRLYVAGHYPSDVTAGAKLGYLLEEYVT